MRSPERRRAVALCLAFGAVITVGCTTQPDTASPARSTPAGPAVESSTGRPTRDEPAASTDTSAGAARPPSTLAEAAPAAVKVTGGDLPPALVDGYHANGGDLIDPAEWTGRFGSASLPELTGPGVRLVEGLRRAELRDGHWTETEEAGWLAMSRADRDSVMSSLRAAADIDGEPSRSTSTDQGADCIIDTYPPDAAGVGWQVQGCSYDKFAGLLSLGISRTGPTDDPPQALIDPTLAPVAATIDGAVSFVEVRFGEPGQDGSTLRLSAHLTSPVGFDAGGGRRHRWPARRLADVPR